MLTPPGLISLLAVFGIFAMVATAATVTTGTLVEEMIDLDRLDRFPDPYYKTVQFASFDRRSDLPGGPGWFANLDGFGGEPIPNFEAVVSPPGDDGIGEYLICDVQGPGAIVRQWTAAIEGTIRVYLDGSDEPVWEGHAMEFLLKPWQQYERDAALDDGVLEETFYQKNAAYCPFPFAKGCRITWTGDLKKIHFYQLQLRLYDEGTRVQTFQPDDLRRYGDTIRRVAGVLRDPDGAWAYRSTQEPRGIDASVAPGARNHEILRLDGPRAIEQLTLRVEADDLDRALRQTVMRIVFDDYPWGQVQSPIGDFFGAAPGINPMDTIPFTVRPDGTMTCRHIMPFERSCRILIDNHGDQQVRITGSALPIERAWDPDRSMHFRARWRVDHDLVGGGEDRVFDVPYLIANGAGVYVGTALMLLNPTPIPTPGGGWWGEGDEKIFVDDDTFPSTFGTGSEDYFNYSWSQPHIFVYPYFGQPRNDGPGNRGFVTNNRWHILDPLPFRYRLSFYMELYHHTTTPGMSYARIGYHYARPGLMDDHLPITTADVRHLELPDNWQPAPHGQAHNAVFHQAQDLNPKAARTRIEEGRLWSGNRVFVWLPQRKGDELELTLPVPETRRYAIYLTATLRASSGPISVRLNDRPAGFGGEAGVIHLHRPYRVILDNFRSHDVELTEGDHTLTIRYEGDVPEGQERTVALDFVWLQRL